MSDQVYRCGISIEYPLAACQYRRKSDGVCTLMPHTPCQYKYKVGNAKQENKDVEESK